MNTAPDSVDANGLTDSVAAFFTFGPGYTVGVYVLTILGVHPDGRRDRGLDDHREPAADPLRQRARQAARRGPDDPVHPRSRGRLTWVASRSSSRPASGTARGSSGPCLALSLVLAVVVVSSTTSDRPAARPPRGGRAAAPSACASAPRPPRGSPPGPSPRRVRCCSPTTRRRGRPDARPRHDGAGRRPAGRRRRQVVLAARATDRRRVRLDGLRVVRAARPRELVRLAAPRRRRGRDRAARRADDDMLASFAERPARRHRPAGPGRPGDGLGVPGVRVPDGLRHRRGGPRRRRLGRRPAAGAVRRCAHVSRRELHDLPVRRVDQHRRLQLQRAVRLPHGERHGPVRPLLDARRAGTARPPGRRRCPPPSRRSRSPAADRPSGPAAAACATRRRRPGGSPR